MIDPATFFEFFFFVVVVVDVFAVVGNRHLGTDGYAVIPWGTLACLSGRRSGQGGASWAASVDSDAGGGKEEVRDILANGAATTAN